MPSRASVVGCVALLIGLSGCEATMPDASRSGTVVEAAPAAGPIATQRPEIARPFLPADAPAGFGAMAWHNDGSIVATRGMEVLKLKTEGGSTVLGSVSFQIERVQLSPASSDLLLLTGTAGEKAVAGVFDAARGKELLKIAWPGRFVDAAAWSPDGTQFVLGTHDATRVYRTSDGEVLCSSTHGAFDVAFAPDGSGLAITSNGDHAVIDLDSCTVSISAASQTGGTFGSAISPSAALVATAADDGHGLEVRRIGATFAKGETWSTSTSCRAHVSPSFSRDGTVLFDTGFGARFASFDTSTGNRIGQWVGDEDHPPLKLAPFEDGKRFLAAYEDRIEVVDAVRGTVDCKAPWPTEGVRAIAVLLPHADGQRFLASHAGEAVVFDAATCEASSRFR